MSGLGSPAAQGKGQASSPDSGHGLLTAPAVGLQDRLPAETCRGVSCACSVGPAVFAHFPHLLPCRLPAQTLFGAPLWASAVGSPRPLLHGGGPARPTPAALCLSPFLLAEPPRPCTARPGSSGPWMRLGPASVALAQTGPAKREGGGAQARGFLAARRPVFSVGWLLFCSLSLSV